MYCPNCGKQIPDNSRFCENCGARVEIEDTFQPSRQKPQRNTYQRQVEKEPSTKNHRKSKKPGFIQTVFLTAVIAVGVWFAKGFLGDIGLSVNTPDHTQPSKQTGNPSVQGETGGNNAIVNEDIGQEDTATISERLSTYDRPTWEEFGWYNEVFNNGVWADATPVTELPYMLGGWKGYIVYDPYSERGIEVSELVNVTLSVDSGGASALVDWYQIMWSGEPPYDETEDADTEFVGSYENGVFELDGPSHLSFISFYEYRGRYYGFGSVVTQDGTIADFWLMR